ncbi:MAG: murein transglycosylase domain-containing protein [Granulosicoccaceae bacterium]|jgi:membrane-bound lytic murein transglycosylase C
MLRTDITKILLLGTACTTLLACSTGEIVNVALSKDPEQFVRNRVQGYKSNPLALARDLKRLTRLLRGEVQREWGEDEVVLPGRHRYVKYTQNYRSRAIINFDSGDIRVETVDTEQPRSSLRNAIITTLLTPGDPRAVDLYSANTVILSGTPYLYGLVRNQHGQSIDSPQRAERYADYLLANRLQVRSIKLNGERKTARSVRLRMVNNHENLRAQRYAHLVEHYAARFGVSRSLVYAVIKTESNFNPFAVSSAPAYGLMQLVPGSGGRDAYRHIKGRDRVPGRDYLFNATNNIELGTGYISVISNKYLKAIHDPVSREYCTIAAYNTGAGNVLRAFSSNREQAARIINRMSPADVYTYLRQKLHYAEARRYLYKVVSARKQFVNL